MEREMDLRTKDVAHVAKVLKDRSDTAGRQGVRPIRLRISCRTSIASTSGGACRRQPQRRQPAHPEGREKGLDPVQREICIDEIQTLLALHYPSQSPRTRRTSSS
jgi:hypothetical protein